jgi:CubicO group peptidase (beta-lactamase class C family)
LYSDIGFILLAELIRRVTRTKFSEALNEHVLNRWGGADLSFLPSTQEHCAATGACPYRGRRLWGEVDDENAWAFGGKAAHAGLFGTAQAVAAFGSSFLTSGKPLLTESSIHEMTKVQVEKKGVRRGLGFQFSSATEGSSTGALSTHAFGHFGFTGSSLWIDRERDLVCVLLTNRVYFGRTNASAITEFRRTMHEAVMKIVQGP